jgi:hypothetical protein
MRRLSLAALLALALAGCETTAQKSARLERSAKRVALSRTGLVIARTSREVKIVRSQTISTPEGAAALVTVHNSSARALRAVPLAVTITDASGSRAYDNSAPGLEAALTSIASLAPGATLTWVDDQVPSLSGATRTIARAGEGVRVPGALPRLSISAIERIEDPTNGSGAGATLTNDSDLAQGSVVVFALALRGGRVVAAGRALVREVPAHGSTPFQVYFLGDPSGARIELYAPATTFD